MCCTGICNKSMQENYFKTTVLLIGYDYCNNLKKKQTRTGDPMCFLTGAFKESFEYGIIPR